MKSRNMQVSGNSFGFNAANYKLLSAMAVVEGSTIFLHEGTSCLMTLHHNLGTMGHC